MTSTLKHVIISKEALLLYEIINQKDKLIYYEQQSLTSVIHKPKKIIILLFEQFYFVLCIFLAIFCYPDDHAERSAVLYN